MGLEVLLLQRRDVQDHNSGAWVFPGGVVDKTDRDTGAHFADMDDGTASRRLNLNEGGLDFYTAAVRECFEETGILLASIESGAESDNFSPATLATMRAALRSEHETFLNMCRRAKLRLRTSELVYFSHWITPKGLPKRFDTRFFMASAPPAQVVEHDGSELVAHLWIEPSKALSRDSPLKLMNATRTVLSDLARFENVAALLNWAQTLSSIPTILPRFAAGANGRTVVFPNDSSWAEIGLLDPLGEGNAAPRIEPGRNVRLLPNLIRVTANNGGAMTGPGTNSYLVGGGTRNEWAVIDPGPLDATHVEALKAAAPGKIRWIFLTHTHSDHSPATPLLKEATGAPVYGQRPVDMEWQDPTFVPDHVLGENERFAIAEGTTLRAIHTPGHASNHFCYLIEEDRVILTGDHIIQGSTVVINPPDGDMGAYLQSLRELLREDLQWIAPGHGFMMDEPKKVINRLIEHRQQREAKVIAAIRQFTCASIDELLPLVYADVPSALHAMARRSLYAHLVKLKNEGTASENDGHYRIRAGATAASTSDCPSDLSRESSSSAQSV